jgi:Ca2+-binding EF-hand superfamily protein
MKKHPITFTTIVLLGSLFCFNAATAEYSWQSKKWGELSKDEKKAKTFLKWDADGDAKLNKAEYTEMTKAQFEKNGKDGYAEAAEKRFGNKDTNEDGFVSFEEQTGMELPE